MCFSNVHMAQSDGRGDASGSNIAMAAQGEPQVQFKVGNARELGVCCSEQEGL